MTGGSRARARSKAAASAACKPSMPPSASSSGAERPVASRMSWSLSTYGQPVRRDNARPIVDLPLLISPTRKIRLSRSAMRGIMPVTGVGWWR